MSPCRSVVVKQTLLSTADRKATSLARNWTERRDERLARESSYGNCNLLCILQTTLTCGVEETHKMTTAHIAHLVDSVVSAHKQANKHESDWSAMAHSFHRDLSLSQVGIGSNIMIIRKAAMVRKFVKVVR